MVTTAERIAACCDLASDVAGTAGEVRLRLMGTSMLPSIWPGDLATIARCDSADLRVGEIVVYRGEGLLTAHRLIGIMPDHLVLRGDSLDRCDPPVSKDRVVGRVVAVSRNGRDVSLRWSLWQRVVSRVVRKSSLCVRILLRFNLGDWFV